MERGEGAGNLEQRTSLIKVCATRAGPGFGGPSRGDCRSSLNSARAKCSKRNSSRFGSRRSGAWMLLALDVSGSMTWGEVSGAPGLTPRDASAAMALVTAATERSPEIVGFHAGAGGWNAGRSWFWPRRRAHAAGDQPAAAARRRGPRRVRPTVPRDGLRVADAVRDRARARGRHVRDLHRLRVVGGQHPSRSGAP